MPAILANWEAEILSIAVLGSPGKKFMGPHLNNSWTWLWYCQLSNTESINRSIVVSAGLKKI
jgi:hypothetical protein